MLVFNKPNVGFFDLDKFKNLVKSTNEKVPEKGTGQIDPKGDSTAVFLQPTNQSVSVADCTATYEINEDYVQTVLYQLQLAISGDASNIIESIFADEIVRFHSAKNVDIQYVVEDISSYSKRWTILSEKYDLIEQNEMLGQYAYQYSKNYTIQRNNNRGRVNDYRIKGYVKFNSEGKIVELVDTETQKLSSQ